MAKLLNLQVSNITSQTVESLGLVNLGNVVRKYCCANQCGIPTFSYTNGNNAITLNQAGYYKIDVNATFSGSASGVGSLTLYVNGLPLSHATASETITTATTEQRSIAFTTTIRVLPNAPITISLVNTSAIDLTILPSTVSITKIC